MASSIVIRSIVIVSTATADRDTEGICHTQIFAPIYVFVECSVNSTHTLCIATHK